MLRAGLANANNSIMMLFHKNFPIKERMRTASKKDNKLAIKLIYAVRVSALVSPVSFVMLLMAAVNPSLNISLIVSIIFYCCVSY